MRISLHGGCEKMSQKCRQIASKEYEILNVPQYSQGMAVARITHHRDWVEDHRTARKRALRADRMGYVVETFEPADWYDDILEINRSKAERQGRPMSEHYVNKVYSPGRIGPSHCDLHHRLEYGVFAHGKLVGYAGMIRCGELLHVSMFLGHWDHLDDGIMYFLMNRVLAHELAAGPVALFYNRYDSGKDGLRFYKDRIGLTEQDIEWTLLT